MAIEPIKHITATSLKEEIRTTGNSPIKVIGSDYNMYVAKNSKNKNPATDIINEVLAHYFLRLWKIPTPNIALITIDPAHLLPYYRDWETDRKSTRLNSSHSAKSRMPSSA